jgi:hypothetical protein
MVSLGVGRGGSPSGAFLEGQQAALTAQSMRNQEAERAQLMQMRAAQEGRTQADFDRLEGAFAPGGIFSGAPAGGAGLDIGGFGGGFFSGAQPAPPTPGQAGIAGAFPSGGAPMRPPGSGGLSFGPQAAQPAQMSAVAARQQDTPLAQRLAPVWNQIEQELGAPQGYLRRLAEVESSLNPAAKNPNSTALGLFQFLRGTAQEYGVADPSDPMQATQGVARYTANSLRALRSALGREPTPGELYLAHQQGQQGAVNLLRDPSRRASDVVGRDAVRLNGGNPDTMTAGEFANLWIRKFEGGSSSRRAVPSAATGATGAPSAGARRTPAVGLATLDALQGRGQAFSDYLEATRGFRSDAPQRGLRPPEEFYEVPESTLERQMALQERTAAFEPRQPSQFDPQPDTVRPRARPVVPEETFEQSEERAIAAEQAVAREAPATERAAQPSGPSTSISMGDGTSVSIPAGLFTPQATTSDIARGASVSDAPKRMPALDAMFGDATRIGVERESLQTMMSLLQQQLEFARQIRDPRMVFELTGQMALAQTRMRSLGLVQAGAEARTGNFDPMAQALSQMTGQQVQITPLAGGRVNVTVDGNLVQSNVPADQVISAYRAGVDEVYQQQIAAQAAEQSRRSGAFFDMYLSAAEEAMKQEAQGTREMQVEAFKRSLDANPAIFTESVTDDTTGAETIIVYDRNNPGRPMETITFRESPLVPGQFEPVRSMLTDMR